MKKREPPSAPAEAALEQTTKQGDFYLTTGRMSLLASCTTTAAQGCAIANRKCIWDKRQIL